MKPVREQCVPNGATGQNGRILGGRARPLGALAVAAAVCCAIVLHLAPARPFAAAVVPVTWCWGLAVVLGVREVPSLRWVLGLAALCRLVVVGTPPLLSDDLYRYLWEGLAWHHGHAPLYEAPATIDGLVPQLRARVTHAELPSVYPPLAMLWFRLSVLLSTHPIAIQAATAIVDLITVAALWRVHRQGAWLYALLPLPVLEAANGAHIDVVAVALATAGIALWSSRPAGATALWWAAALTKLFPVVLLPVVLRRLPPRRWVPLLVALMGLTIAVSWPHLRAEVPPGLLAYGSRWSFNGFAWAFLHPILGPDARPVVALGAICVGLVALARCPDPRDVWWWCGTTFVLLSPTVHPWYVLWAVVPDLLLGRRGWAAASVWLSGSYLVLLAYDPSTGRWAEAPWLWWVTWMPALVALGWGYARSDATATDP